MLGRIAAAVAIHACVCLAAAAGERLSFVRTIPAEHELPGERVALIYAIADNEHVRTFIDVFVERANRARALEVDDATEHNHVVGGSADDALLRRLHREHPADVYLGVNRFSCEEVERSGEVGSYNVDGVREKKQQRWIDSICRARIDILDGPSIRRVSSFDVKGEGTSPRTTAVMPEDRKIAMMQAARYAAISASELITPRQVRESIELDERAPGFEEVRSLIALDRLPDVRQRWERLLRANEGSAPLHYDLGAVCEALGDIDGARQHYEAARRLSPDEPRYKSELTMFRRRSMLKK